MKKKIVAITFGLSLGCFAGSLIDAVYTVPHEFDCLLESGHIQGASCCESGIFLSHRLGIDKIGWDGKLIKHVDAPSHLGDCAYANGRVYGVFGLTGKKGMIREWDADLNFIRDVPVDCCLDGAVVLGDKLYSSPDDGAKPHLGCRVMSFGLDDLLLRDTYELDIGYSIYYGVQTMATHGNHIFLGNYGGPANQGNPNKYNLTILSPDVKPVTNLNFSASEGFCFVPQSISKRQMPVCLVVRALGGNMQGWRKDPQNNPPRVRIDFFEYENKQFKNITRYDPQKEKYKPVRSVKTVESEE